MRTWIRLLLVGLLAPALLVGCGDDPAAKAKPASSEELVQVGLLSLQQGDKEAALNAFKQAAEKKPENHFAHYNLGVIYQEQAKPVQALAEYTLAVTAKPDYVPALFNQATIYATSDPALAIATYRKVIKLQPKAPTAYLNLGLLEAQVGQTAQAKKDLATAVKQDPQLISSVPKELLPAGAIGSPTPPAG